MKYMLDTDICIYIIKNKSVELLNRVRKKGLSSIGISAITLSELEYGISKSEYKDQNRLALTNFLLPFEIFNYDEMAALNVISGNINIETILNGGATTTTDTTNNWTDTAIHELEVRVSAAGVVTYKIDGVDPLVTAAFTFDDAEVVVPFFYTLQAADPEAADISLIEFECGLQ